MLRRLDPRLDGELAGAEASEVDAHLQDCAVCRGELESRRALKRGLQSLVLPDCPPMKLPFDQPVRTRWFAAAAALLAVALVLILLPSSVPNVVALSSQLHDQVLDGSLTPRDLGLKKVALPGTQYLGECVCPAELGSSSPFIVYRRGDTPISLLILETDPGRLPDSARRTAGGRDYHFFRSKRNNAIVCQSGKLCHIWVSRLDEAELVRTILATREGQSLLSGEKLTLEGVT